MIKRLLIVFLLCVAVVGCKQTTGNHDADYYRAKKPFAAGQYEQAHDFMLKSAERGDSEAQYDLACLYLNGVGVKQDIDKAFEWYLSSANLGNIRATTQIGSMYLDGVMGP